MTGVTAAGPPEVPGRSIAVVGLACRYPDADDPAALLDLVLTGRRAFRRIPRGRLDLADYYSPDPGAEDATYSTRAALIEGWRFDTAPFGVSAAGHASADPAHWLALETTARALAAAGFPGGAGLPGARAGAYLGSSMSGHGAPAAALRLRWPYSRRVIAEALSATGVPDDVADRVLTAAANRYLAPFPPVTAGTLAGSTPASIVTGICGQFGLRGGGVAVDAADASSLAATASACLALAAGELDAAVAGGVDLRIDPLDLVGLAKAGLLAIGDVRVYDEQPTGFLPGEGCGVVLLMRTADARAANLPVYAEILGWGIAAGGLAGRIGPDPAGQAGQAGPDPAGQLLAMRRAHEMARVDPADVQLVEGCGTGVPAGDHAELTALAELRAGARHVAALGSISANIGNTRAAAGAAGLIKTVLAVTNGVLPPSTGVRTPHPMLRDGRAALRLPVAPEPWPAGVRHAGVSAISQDGLAVHLVLRGEAGRPPAVGRTPQPRARSMPRAVQTRPPAPARSRRQGGLRGRTSPPAQNLTVPAFRLPVTRSAAAYSAGAEHPSAYLLRAADQPAMIAILNRIAAIAPWLSDSQLQDLAVQLSHTPAAADLAAAAGPAAAGGATSAAAGVRIALTASGQDELAGLASEAARLLPGLTSPVLGTTPGIFADPGGGGDPGGGDPGGGDPGGGGGASGPGRRIALVISGQPDDLPDLPQRQLSRILAVLRWLDELGVNASAAVGHGIGELAGLVWAGCTTPADARMLTALRSAALAAPPGSAPGQLGSTIGKFSTFTFRPPRRRLVSGSTGREVTGPAAIAEVLCAELFAARLATGDAHLITWPARPPGPARPAMPARPAAESEDGGRTDDQDPLAAAVAAVAEDAGLLVLTGQDQHLADAVARPGARGGPAGRLPAPQAICIDGDPADGSVAQAAAALFAAGALTRPEALYAGHPSRPFDIWREQVFLTHPCEAPVREPANPAQGADERTATPDAGLRVPADPGNSPRAAAAAGEARAGGPAAGVGPWVRCYVERTGPTALPAAADDDQPWRLHTGGCEPLRQKAGEIFRHDPAASRTLALIGGLDDAAAREASVLAARDATGTGRLVVIGPGPGPAGLWATLHAEHPSVGITVVRAPLTPDGIGAARRVAAASPGEYRELSVGPGGTAAEPVLTALPGLGGGEFPLGPDDVVLLSRGSGAAGLVLAQVLACSGAAVAVIGRDHPDRDDAVLAGLEQLRGAGAVIGYELVDLADHAALTAAVRRVEAQFGCVTAISHAAGSVARSALAELTPAVADDQVRRNTDPLDQLAAAARTAARGGTERSGRLRLIITSGSVIGRYGLAGEGIGALVTGALADLAQRLAAASPGCRALHVDWPAWSSTGLGQRADLAERLAGAGFTPLPVAEGSRQLLKLLATDELPARVAVHGRVGVPAPRPIAAAVPAPVPSPGSGPGPGSADVKPASTRFVERVLVHYPGVELIAEARLSLIADPYLGDYQADGVPVLPPTMALEAMAQAASVLAGTPLRRAGRVSMSAPIVLPAGTPGSQTVIRLCALRAGDAVTVLVRSDNSGFGVEHCRAVFSAGQEPADPQPQAASRSAADPGEQAAEAAYGSELYGSVYFQAGRFGRLATVRLAGSRAAIGLADGADELPWFGLVRQAGPADRQHLVLGSAGLSDATLQLVQACVPHRRLIMESCDHVVFAGQEAEGMVTIRAVRQNPAPPVQAEPVPRPRTAPGESAAETAGPGWDVDATDAAGRSLITWKGLRMRDAGPPPLAAGLLRVARQEPAPAGPGDA